MTSKQIIRSIAVTFLVLSFVVAEVSAGGRVRSGSYQGPRSSGTWQQRVERTPGQVQRSTTWQNQRGQGSRVSTKYWNKESGTGDYSATTTLGNGRTLSRQGTVTRNGQGSYTVDGTRTGPNGKVTNVKKTLARNADGSTAVHSAYTGPQGKTKNIDSTIQRTAQGRAVSGTYATSGGKSGTFDSKVTRTENGLVKEQSLTNQDGRNWHRNIIRTRQGNTITRQAEVTNALGQTRSHTSSATVDTSVPTE